MQAQTFFLALLGAGLCFAGANDSIPVLLVTGIDHPAHDWRTTSAAVESELAKDPRMSIQVLRDPDQLEKADLSRFRVVFLNFNNWERPDPGPRAKENLTNFVARGGGLVVMHFACGAFSGWPEYANLAGKVWDRTNTHDPRGRVFHTPLGHDARAVRMPGTAELIRRGTAWAAGASPVP